MIHIYVAVRVEYHMRNLLKTVAVITIFSIVAKIFSFFFRVYLSRTIGAEGLGYYYSAISIFTVLLTLVSSGIPLIVSRLTTRYTVKGDKTSQHKMITASLIVALLSSVLVCLIVFLFRNLMGNFFTDERCITILLVLLPAILFNTIFNVFKGFMWGKQDYFGVCIGELIEQISRFLVCFLLLHFGLFGFDPAVNAGLSLTISCLFSLCFGIAVYFLRGGRLRKPSGYKEIIMPSLSLSGMRTISSLTNPLIALILPNMLVASGYTTAQAMGLYGTAVGMTFPMLFLPMMLIGSLSMALVPDLSKAMEEKNEQHISEQIKSSVTFSLFVSAIFLPIYIGAGENIGLFLFDHMQSGVLLVSSAWLMIPLSLSSITSNILNALGQEKRCMLNNLIGTLFLILSIVFLPNLMGIRALIAGMGSCATVISFLNFRRIRKITGVEARIKKTVLLLSLFALPSSAIAFFMTNLLNNVLPLFFNLAVTSILSAGFYLTLCILFNVIRIDAWVLELKKKISFDKKKKRKKKPKHKSG